MSAHITFTAINEGKRSRRQDINVRHLLLLSGRKAMQEFNPGVMFVRASDGQLLV